MTSTPEDAGGPAAPEEPETFSPLEIETANTLVRPKLLEIRRDYAVRGLDLTREALFREFRNRYSPKCREKDFDTYLKILGVTLRRITVIDGLEEVKVPAFPSVTVGSPTFAGMFSRVPPEPGEIRFSNEDPENSPFGAGSGYDPRVGGVIPGQ